MLTTGADKLWSSTTAALYASCQEQDENDVAVSSSDCIYGITVELYDNDKKADPEFADSFGAYTQYDWTGSFTHAGLDI